MLSRFGLPFSDSFLAVKKRHCSGAATPGRWLPPSPRLFYFWLSTSLGGGLDDDRADDDEFPEAGLECQWIEIVGFEAISGVQSDDHQHPYPDLFR